MIPFYAFFTLASFDFESTILLWNSKVSCKGSVYERLVASCRCFRTQCRSLQLSHLFLKSKKHNLQCDSLRSSQFWDTEAYIWPRALFDHSIDRLNAFSMCVTIIVLCLGALNTLFMVLFSIAIKTVLGVEVMTKMTMKHKETSLWLLVPILPVS